MNILIFNWITNNEFNFFSQIEIFYLICVIYLAFLLIAKLIFTCNIT